MLLFTLNIYKEEVEVEVVEEDEEFEIVLNSKDISISIRNKAQINAISTKLNTL